jgi:hypothetical protein
VCATQQETLKFPHTQTLTHGHQKCSETAQRKTKGQRNF